MNRHRGFNFRRACRVLNPGLAAKLDPVPPLERDRRERLYAIAKEIERLTNRRNAKASSKRLAELAAERRRLRDALNQDKTGGKP